MTVLLYDCTRDAVSNWHFVGEHPRGIAYETQTHFVHFCGRNQGAYVVSSGLTITEGKTGSLSDWVTSRFGAQNVQTAQRPAGQVVERVWRPGLYYFDDVTASLGSTVQEIRQAERGLVSLILRLNEILNYIEPLEHGLLASGHRTRELLILACSDVEDQWTRLLRAAGVTAPRLTTNNYWTLKNPLHLDEFEVAMPGYAAVPPCIPFRGWDQAQPTQSLSWYDAYNRTKHDKSSHLVDATLGACIAAVAANIVLFCAQYGPQNLDESRATIGSAFNELFCVQLVDPDKTSFYVPLINTSDLTPGIQVFESKGRSLPRTRIPLSV